MNAATATPQADTLAYLLRAAHEAAAAHYAVCSITTPEAVWMATAGASNRAIAAVIAFARANPDAPLPPAVRALVSAYDAEKEATAAYHATRRIVEALGGP